MAVAVSCPSCRARLKLGAAPAPGKVARCPRCKGAVPLDPADERTRPKPVAPGPESGSAETLPEPPRPGAGTAPPHPASTASLDKLQPALAPPQAPDEIGRLGPYRVLDRLGAGGMGVVYRAEEPRLQRQVALKVLLPEFASNATWKARFLREARAQAAVEHEHVVAIYQADEHEGTAYIAMPLLKGQTLGAALKQNPRPPLKEVLRIGREVAEGLAAAHEQGLVHRDIKPTNVWLDGRRRRVKILDFGLARGADAAEPDASRVPSPAGEAGDGPLTVQGAVVGTPAYMSPEQARGKKVDFRTDLFSLGVVLYQMTTGEMPFVGATIAVLFEVVSHDPPAPAARNPDVPVAVSDFVMRLLAKSAEDRPASAEAVAEELQRLEAGLAAAPALVATPVVVADDPWADLGDEPTAAGAAEPTRRAPRAPVARSRRAPLLAGAVIGCVVLAGGLVAVVALGSKRPPAKSDPEQPSAVAKAAPAPKPAAPKEEKSPVELAPKDPPTPAPAEPALEVAPPPHPVRFKLSPLPTEKDFRPYSSVAGDYKVLFPSGFAFSRSTPFIVGKDTVRNLTTDSVTWWSGVVFLVGFVDYPDDAAKQPAAARLDKFRDADKGPNSKILDEKEVTVGAKKYPGRDLLIEVPGTFVRKRVVVAGARLYFVAVQGTKEAVTSDAADTFFGSFEITK